jgi:hypothetical protein
MVDERIFSSRPPFYFRIETGAGDTADIERKKAKFIVF